MVEMKKVLRTRYYRKWGYVLYYYIVDGSEWQTNDYEMCSAFTLPDLHYLGNSKTAYFICKTKGLKPELRVKPDKTNKEILDSITQEEKAKGLLLEKPIKFQSRSCSIGWNEEEQKWYGWSHRAIFGFGVGSQVKKESSGYQPTDKEDFFEDYKRWYDIGETRECETPDKKCISELIDYKFDVPDIRKEQDGLGIYMNIKTKFDFDRRDYNTEYWNPYPKEWGRGEWTAKTIEEAKEMASNCAESVS